MIDSTKVEAVIADEVTELGAMLDATQALLDLCEGQHSPQLDKLRLTQVRTVERLAAFPAAVMAHGPFKDIGAAHAALEMEARFVAAAIDGGN
jgi:hypothetical protein